MRMARSVSTEVTAITAVLAFLAGGLVLSGGSSGYNTKCSDLLESRTINYTGSIDEYSGMLEPDLFASSDSDKGGVLLMSSDRLAVENGSRLEFEFTQKMWIECNDGRITVDTYFSDENVLEDKSQKNGDSSGQ